MEWHSRRLSRRSIIRTAAFGIAGVAISPLIAACGQAATPAPTSAPAATSAAAGTSAPAAQPTAAQAAASGTASVKVSVWGDVSDLQINKGIIGAFAKTNSKITVTPEQWVGDYYQKLQVGIAGNTVTDMVYFQGWMWQPYTLKGQITDITSYVNTDKASLPNNLFPDLDAYKRQLLFQGKYYGMPQDTGSMVVLYNKDLFDAASVPYPKDTWTYQDFLDTCQKVQDGLTKAGKTGVFAYQPNYNDDYTRDFPWWRMNGGMEFDTLESPKKAQWDQPEVAAAWQNELHDLASKGLAISQGALLGGGGSNAYYTYGIQNALAAMKVEGPWFLPQMWGPQAATKGGLNYDAVQMPKGSKGYSSFWQVEPVCIMKASKNPDACFEYLKYVVSSDGQQFVANGGRMTNTPDSITNQWVPITQKTYNCNNAKAFAFSDGASMVITGGVSSDQFDVTGGLNAARDSVINGSKTAKDALAQANPLIQGILDTWYKNNPGSS